MGHFNGAGDWGGEAGLASSGLHDDLLGQHAFQGEIQDMNEQYNATRSQRIRAAMFPETLAEGEDVGAEVDIGQGTNVGRLSEGSQLMKTAVVNIINYQDEADAAARALPELLRLLGDGDPATLASAANLLHGMSKKEPALKAMLACPDLVPAILRAMESTRDPSALADLTGALYQLSKAPGGLLAVFRSGGIRVLIALLSSPVELVVFYAITTLHNLIEHQDGAIEAIRREGGVEAMVVNLERPVEKFLAILTDSLKSLAFHCPDAKMIIASQGGPGRLVQIMRSYHYEKLLWTTARLLKVLSVCPQNKQGIIAEGGMQALGHHLQSGSPRLLSACLLALRNLSDAGTKEENMERVLDALLVQLGSGDLEAVALAAGTLSNLSCNNQRNKAYLCQKGGIQMLIQCLNTHSNSADIAEPALCTLRHLTSRHPHADSAQNEVRHHRGLPLVVHFLRTNRLPLMKAALGLLKNLVSNPANRGPLREAEVVQLSAAALQNAFMALHEAQVGRQEPPVQEGVSVVEIVEAAASALQSLAKDDPVNRDLLIRMAPLTPILVNLLASEHDGILRGVTGLMCELSLDGEGAAALEREGSVPPLTELMHSKNTHVNTYAASALFNINKDKPGEYGSRLDQEISAALCGGGVGPGDVSTAQRSHQEPWSEGLSEMTDDHAYDDMLYGGATYDPTGSLDRSGALNNSRLNGSALHNGSAHRQPPPAPPGGWFDTDL